MMIDNFMSRRILYQRSALASFHAESRSDGVTGPQGLEMRADDTSCGWLAVSSARISRPCGRPKRPPGLRPARHDAAVKLHGLVGPGLLESVYERLLARALERRGLKVVPQYTSAIEIDGERFERAFTVDLFVDDRVVVEIKSVEKLAPFHYKQVLTYLRLLNLPVGLLFNFRCATMKEGIHCEPPRLRVSVSA